LYILKHDKLNKVYVLQTHRINDKTPSLQFLLNYSFLSFVVVFYSYYLISVKIGRESD